MIQKHEVDKQQYNEIFNAQITNKNDFKEHIFGSRKRLYINDVLVATYCPSNTIDLGVLDPKVFHRFLASFNKQFYRQIINNQSLMELTIDFDGQSRNKIIENWDALPISNYFYSIDIKNAYWQIAHKIGYINDRFYQKYLYNDDFKEAKRYCISFLGRSNKTNYISNKSNYPITCNMDLFNNAYTNIRNMLYNIVNECVEITDNCYLEYNIDGLYVLNTDVKKVKSVLHKHGIISKLIECIKVSDTQYLCKKKLRNFKR